MGDRGAICHHPISEPYVTYGIGLQYEHKKRDPLAGVPVRMGLFHRRFLNRQALYKVFCCIGYRDILIISGNQ